VVVLPRIPHDDFEYVVRRPGEDVAAAWASMRNDLQQVRRLGGFYFFDFHTSSGTRRRSARACST
jgi:hypothetical protein